MTKKSSESLSRRTFVKAGLGTLAALELNAIAGCSQPITPKGTVPPGGKTPTPGRPGQPGSPSQPGQPTDFPKIKDNPNATNPSGGELHTKANSGEGLETRPSGPRVEHANPGSHQKPPNQKQKEKVFVVKATDRVAGLKILMGMIDWSFAKGRKILLKPNLVSSQAFPVCTHDDTLKTVVAGLKKAGCKEITLGESSGLGRTKSVLASKGTHKLCQDMGVQLVNFDDMPKSSWESFTFPKMNWGGKLAIPKVMRAKEHAVVLLPCCKTHQFGGDFTMSLKLAVGITPVGRRSGMHSSGDLPGWVADINKGYTPDLIIMDALSCFISGGPTSGELAHPGVLVAGTNRVAVDAVGVAILKSAGAKTTPLKKKIFEQRQIARAVEIGLGPGSPSDIEIIGNHAKTTKMLRGILDIG